MFLFGLWVLWNENREDKCLWIILKIPQTFIYFYLPHLLTGRGSFIRLLLKTQHLLMSNREIWGKLFFLIQDRVVSSGHEEKKCYCRLKHNIEATIQNQIPPDCWFTYIWIPLRAVDKALLTGWVIQWGQRHAKDKGTLLSNCWLLVYPACHKVGIVTWH